MRGRHWEMKIKPLQILFEAGPFFIPHICFLLILTTTTHSLLLHVRARTNAWSQLEIAAVPYCCVVLMVFQIAVGVKLWLLFSRDAFL